MQLFCLINIPQKINSMGKLRKVQNYFFVLWKILNHICIVDLSLIYTFFLFHSYWIGSI